MVCPQEMNHNLSPFVRHYFVISLILYEQEKKRKVFTKDDSFYPHLTEVELEKDTQ